jgi:hypothetical protein
MEYNDEPIGYDTYLELLNFIEELRELAQKSLVRGELKAGRDYRRKLRSLPTLIKKTRAESLKRSSRNPNSF